MPTWFQLKKESPTAVSGKNAFNAIQGDSFNNSISTSDGNVNAKFSPKGMDSFVPIRFGIKQSVSGKNYLYVVIDNEAIKKAEVTAKPSPKNGATTLTDSAEISIAKVLSKVNSPDIVKYFPDEFLDSERKRTKYETIAAASGEKTEPAGSLSPEITGVPATLTGSAVSISNFPVYVNKSTFGQKRY